MTRKETMSILVAIIAILYVAGVILLAAYYQEPSISHETSKPPVIERCDKTLWDRIRSGCDE